MTGVELIDKERTRQLEREGWSPAHDDEHDSDELALAAVCYAAPKSVFVHEERSVQLNSSRGIDPCCYSYPTRMELGYWDPWPWDDKWDKRKKHDRIKQLSIAGALIAAEIDRLKRIEVM